MSGKGRIGPLWRNFLAETDLLLPGEPDRSLIFSVYTDYESDETGAYTVVLGRTVGAPTNDLPSGMKRVEIPSAKYLVFRALDRNPESIREAWTLVHQYFQENPEPSRAFTVDFEKYGPNGVSLYIAVR
jgi:predicted transcriptional regulator YdeE